MNKNSRCEWQGWITPVPLFPKEEAPKEVIVPLEYKQPFLDSSNLQIEELTETQSKLMARVTINASDAVDAFAYAMEPLLRDTEYYKAVKKFNTLKQKTMRTDVALLEALRETMMNDLHFSGGLCSLKRFVAENNEEERRLGELIKEMKPDYSTQRNGYYWWPGDKLIRYEAIEKLIKDLSNKTPVEEKWELLQEYKSPAWEINKGEILTKKRIKKYLGISSPDDYPDWFEKVKKEKTLLDYEDEFWRKMKVV